LNKRRFLSLKKCIFVLVLLILLAACSAQSADVDDSQATATETETATIAPTDIVEPTESAVQATDGSDVSVATPTGIAEAAAEITDEPSTAPSATPKPTTTTTPSVAPTMAPDLTDDSFVAVSGGGEYIAAVFADGRCVTDSYDSGLSKINSWRGVTKLSASDAHAIALTTDGKVLTATSQYGAKLDTSNWSGIVDVAMGYDFALGLDSVGTVHFAGLNSVGQGDFVSEGTWKGVAQITAGDMHSVALFKDGHIEAVGFEAAFAGIEKWDYKSHGGLVQISAAGGASFDGTVTGHTVGLCADGTVLLAGGNDYGESDTDWWAEELSAYPGDTVAAVSAGFRLTAGLTDKGHIILVGYGGGNTAWSNMASVKAGRDCVLGVTSDGQLRYLSEYGDVFLDAAYFADDSLGS
jgi:hypothetical protein